MAEERLFHSHLSPMKGAEKNVLMASPLPAKETTLAEALGASIAELTVHQDLDTAPTEFAAQDWSSTQEALVDTSSSKLTQEVIF